MCVSGQCLPKPSPSKYHSNQRDPSLGVALIVVQKAHVPKKDPLSKADPYVQVFLLDMDDDHQELIGTTRMVRNHHEPDFNQHFSSKLVPKATRIMFKVFDFDDMDEDDLVGTVTVRLDHLVDMGLVGRPIKKKLPGGWLLFTIYWRPQLAADNYGVNRNSSRTLSLDTIVER